MCDTCEWEAYLDTIQEAIDDAANLPQKAEDFAASVTEKLEDIQQWVEDNEHITEAQAEAVDNMAEGIGKWRR
jgi:hypothetical protein